MRMKGVFVTLMVALSALVSGQQPARTRAVLVTNDGTLHLQAWRAGPTGYEAFWEATPRAADVDLAARRGEVVMPARDAIPVICDLDGDGSNDLLVMDALGIIVYGKTPAYLPFETVLGGPGSPGVLAAGDVDGDRILEIVTQRTTASGRDLDVWKVGPDGLRRLWGQQGAGRGPFLLLDDVDGDRLVELIVESFGQTRTVQIFKRGTGPSWEPAASLVSAGGYELAGRAADVDADGIKEIIVGSNSGQVTVYKHRRGGARSAYDILWQSAALVAPGATPPERAFVPAVEAGDVDGDGTPEIVAASYGVGRPASQGPGAGRIHVFKRDARGGFASVWVSDWTQTPRSSGLAIGDLNGDGVNEIVYNGRDIYGFDPTTKGFRLQGTVGGTPRDAVVGNLGDLREPANATRIVPLYWTLANRAIASGQTAEIALTLLNVWAPARDVRVNVTSGSPTLQAESSVTVPAAISTASTVVTPKFTAAVKGDQTPVVLKVEITAAGGYRQTIPVELRVTPPLPTYDAANLEARIAAASAHARDENRRVLVAWGSNADKASQALIELTVRNSDVSRKLLYEYDVVRADAAGNDCVAAKLGAKVTTGTLPQLTVLDAEGHVLANEGTGTLMAAGASPAASDPKLLMAFLTKHQAPYLNAETLFAGALSRAKKDQKTLFLWFSAPW